MNCMCFHRQRERERENNQKVLASVTKLRTYKAHAQRITCIHDAIFFSSSFSLEELKLKKTHFRLVIDYFQSVGDEF